MATDPTPNLTKAKGSWAKFQTLWSVTLPTRRLQIFEQTNLMVELRKK